MGSQQLLLLVLTILLVGLVLVSGYKFTNDYYQNSDREQLLSRINHLYNSAAQYRKKVTEFGGGNGFYNGWVISDEELNFGNSSIEYVIHDDKITFLGVGSTTGWNGNENTKTWVKYSDNSGKTIRFLN